MKLFLVSPQERSLEAIKNKIESHFEPAYYISLEKRPYPLWVVATEKYQTTSEIAGLLGMLEEDNSKCNAGIVFEIGSYRGFDSINIWEKLDAWAEG